MTRRALGAAVAATWLIAAGTAGAKPLVCTTAISRASAAFVQARTKLLQKCRDGVLKGTITLAPGTSCRDRPQVVAAVTKAHSKLETAIAKTCGGKNKTCSAADVGADADDAPATVGFPSTCPNLENGICSGAIGDCSDVAACLECLADTAVDQAVALAYDDFVPADPKSKDKVEKARAKCQQTVGRATAKLVSGRSRLLAKCWAAASKTGSGECPDAATAAALGTLAAKQGSTIAKACQGADKTPGTVDDFTPAAIGFPTQCLDTVVPACAGPVDTLAQLIDCVVCVAGFKVDCVDAAAIPALAGTYPAPCNAGTIPTQTFTLDAVASGFYRDDGVHEVDDYAAGWFAGGSPGQIELRDYFVFDLSSVTGTIVSALLRVSTAPPAFIRYGSSDPSETFTLFDVATALGTLTTGPDSTTVFDDLGTGTPYGGVTVTSALGTTVDVPLDAAGIAFLQGSSGQVALGGALTTLTKGVKDEFLFNSTDAALTRQLVIKATD